jgi:hypothetical protein
MSVAQAIANKFRRESKFTDSGKKFSVRILPMTEGISVAKKLLSVIAPTTGSALDGLQHDDILHGAPKSLSTLAMILCNQIDKVQVENLIIVLLQDLYIDNQEVNIDEYFAANYGELIEVLEFSLEVNFKSFFMGKGIKARLMKGVQTLMAQMSPESETE